MSLRTGRGRDVGELVVLRDGSDVVVRPVRPDDAPLFTAAFERLGQQSRLQRFLSPKQSLSAGDLRFFTEVDHHDHEGLVAISPADGGLIGDALFVRDCEWPDVADMAITVIDEWQGRGVGSALVSRLMGRAWDEGIRRFTALVAADNHASFALLEGMAAAITRRVHDRGVVELELALSPWTVEDDVLSALHALGPQRASA